MCVCVQSGLRCKMQFLLQATVTFERQQCPGRGSSQCGMGLCCVGGARVLKQLPEVPAPRRTQGAVLFPNGVGSWLLSLRTQSLSLWKKASRKLQFPACSARDFFPPWLSLKCGSENKTDKKKTGWGILPPLANPSNYGNDSKSLAILLRLTES